MREETVVIGKGVHTPLCYPGVIAKQFTVSLDRMKADYVDIYFMHRDNPDIPVGEFVDAMDPEVKAGRIRGPFGGSNWTRERFDEGDRPCRKDRQDAPERSVEQFLAGGDGRSGLGRLHRVYRQGVDGLLGEKRVTNFAWSSQARGFFTERAGRGKMADTELARSWYSEGNFARRDRAIDLGERIGKDPTQVALAYVLAQKGHVVP